MFESSGMEVFEEWSKKVSYTKVGYTFHFAFNKYRNWKKTVNIFNLQK